VHKYRMQYQEEVEKIKKMYPVRKPAEWLKRGKIRDAWIYAGPLLRKMIELEGYIPGLWYNSTLPLKERIYDLRPEIVDMLKEARVNVVTVGYFTKNFGFKIEKSQYEETSKFIRECHKQDIKVLVYMSFSNIFKSFLKEYPEAITWVQRNYDGTPKKYGPYKERFHGCYNNPGWFEHQKKIAITVVESGADGVNIDNTGINLGGCYCGFCQEKFKKFSQEKFGKEYTMPTKEDWTDPLWQAFIEFRNLTWYQGVKRFYNYLHSLKEDIVVKLETSDGLPGSAQGYEKAQDLILACDCQDMIESEVGAHFPRIEKGRIDNFINNYKVLLACSQGKPVEVLGYTPGHRNPAPSQLKLAIAEGITHEGIHIQNWRIEFMDYLSYPELRKAIKEYNSFHEQNEEYYVDVKSKAQVAVLYSLHTNGWYKHNSKGGVHKPNDSDDFSRPFSFSGFTQALQESQIPYDVLIAEDLSSEMISSYKCLILPNVTCMGDEEVKMIKEFVKKGGSLIATYQSSLYNTYGEKRDDYALAELLGLNEKNKNSFMVENTYGKGKSIFFSGKIDFNFFNNRDEKTRNILSSSVKKITDLNLSISNAPYTLIVNLTGKDKLMLLHLLNYELNKEHKDNIKVNLTIPSKEIKKVFAISPDFKEEIKLNYEIKRKNQDRWIIKFTVPLPKIYTLVLIEFKGYKEKVEKKDVGHFKESKEDSLKDESLSDHLIETI